MGEEGTLKGSDPTAPFVTRSVTSRPVRKRQYQMRLMVSPKCTGCIDSLCQKQGCSNHQHPFLLILEASMNLLWRDFHPPSSVPTLSGVDSTSGARSSQPAYLISQVLFRSGHRPHVNPMRHVHPGRLLEVCKGELLFLFGPLAESTVFYPELCMYVCVVCVWRGHLELGCEANAEKNGAEGERAFQP